MKKKPKFDVSTNYVRQRIKSEKSFDSFQDAANEVERVINISLSALPIEDEMLIVSIYEDGCLLRQHTFITHNY